MDELFYTFIDEEGLLDLDLFLVPLVLDIILVYFNLYVLIPKFLLKKKYANYFISTGAMLSLSAFLVWSYMTEGDLWSFEVLMIVSVFIGTLTLLATAIAIKVGKYFYEQLKYTEQLEFSQSQLELNYLKQQVNPHFLFNVLNTIYIQSSTDPTSVSSTVLHLSDMLRYQIYDAGNKKEVSLQQEIEFLKNYIALEKLRRKNIEVVWIEEEALPRIKITPFLFLPLVENAFKHSKYIDDRSTILRFSWKKTDTEIGLEVSNPIGDVPSKEEGGFGIDNLKKRLELLYPEKYRLQMSTKNDLFLSILYISTKQQN